MQNSSLRAVGVVVGVTILLGVLLAWFAWPARELEPRDLPIVVAGPPPAADALAAQLDSAQPGAFEVTTVADEAAADAALRDRSAYAAFVVGPAGASLHTASAASPGVATLLSQVAQEMGGATGSPVKVVDVVPGSPDDPRGAGFASGYLPLVLASLVAGILFALLVAGRAARLLGLLAFAVLAGLAGSGLMQWLGLLGGDYLAGAGAIALLSLAVAAAVTGLAALLGRAGIGLAVLVIFVFGNPISGVVAAPELLPQPWGEVGQFLPAGAGGTLLRSAAFFDWAGSDVVLWTLVGWAVVGLALVLLGRARVQTSHAPTPTSHAATPDATPDATAASPA